MTQDCQQLLAVSVVKWINVNLDSTVANMHTDGSAYPPLCSKVCIVRKLTVDHFYLRLFPSIPKYNTGKHLSPCHVISSCVSYSNYFLAGNSG